MNMTIITSYEAKDMYIICGFATDEIYLFTLLYSKKKTNVLLFNTMNILYEEYLHFAKY